MAGTTDSKRRLFILVAGELGRELETWLSLVPESSRDWELAGYLHTGNSQLAEFPTKYAVVGDWEDYPFRETDLCVLALASAQWKRRISDAVRGRAGFLTFVSPTAIVSPFARIGEGCVICPNCVISTNVQIGNFVTINTGSHIGHDARIGDYTTLMASVNLGGHVQLGECVYAGTGTVVIPSRKIAAHTTLGAGSVVVHNIRQAATYFGNPAKKFGPPGKS
jgi:sugar O-acyltransferase (sialic acid O-acetyltransferase NeuD family)